MDDCFVVFKQSLGRISSRYNVWIINVDVDVGFVKIKVVAGELVIVGRLPIAAVVLTPTERFSTLVEGVSLGPGRSVWHIRRLAFGLFDLGFKRSEPLDVRGAAHVARVLCLIGIENVLLDEIQVSVGADGSRDVSLSAVCRGGAQRVVVGMG